MAIIEELVGAVEAAARKRAVEILEGGEEWEQQTYSSQQADIAEMTESIMAYALERAAIVVADWEEDG